VKLALAQINPTVGDFPGNIRKIVDTTRAADDCGADLVIFPELAICGYFPADLLEKRSFLERTQDALHRVAEQATEGRRISVLCGCVTAAAEATGKRVMNSAALLRRGRIDFVQSKMLLPYYDVFDEQRYFAPAASQSVFELVGERLGITICEDAWNDKNFWPQRLYPLDPVESLMQQGATLILNISASPFSRGKRETRQKMLTALARRHRVPVVMVNQIGGNDSLIFDGSSIAIDAQGKCIGRAKSFHEDLVIVDTSAPKARPVDESSSAEDGEDAAIYQALVLGTRDYVRKCGFSKAIIGLSGGIDSALVACLAVEALGSENVLGVGMPSEYSSPGSIEDARQLACNLGIEWRLIPIQSMFRAHLEALRPLLKRSAEDVTEENLQSRIRGALLMAVSNNRSALVLTTGNKSEMATGYCTLYGDMVGALAVIADVYKTLVYRLASYANRERNVIPESTLTKPPSAELRPGQKDTDCLPPYDVLDPILEAYVEHYATAEMIVEGSSKTPSGPLDLELVRSVVRMVEKSEYKRQQAAPVLKVTQKSFGSGRRFPIAVQIKI
jgi:NAD+ synthase/NAD+ synthase (glutamine-hydrolysing)